MLIRSSRLPIAAAVMALALLTAGCSRAPETAPDPALRAVVYKTEGCGCCNAWITHLESAGFVVEAHNVDNLGPTKDRVGVPVAMGSCHTAEVGGYFVDGHVPAPDIKRLLRERPMARGLTVPAMPVGSPGMEVPSGHVDPYDVFLVAPDGSTSVFAHHDD